MTGVYDKLHFCVELFFRCISQQSQLGRGWRTHRSLCSQADASLLHTRAKTRRSSNESRRSLIIAICRLL